MMKQIFARALAVAVLALPCALHAQDAYPSKPIRIVIGFAAGGGTDIVLRTLATKMGELLKTPFVVDNKPGANGNIANDIVAKASPDGYTLGYNTSSMVLSPSLYKNLTYDFNRDLTPVVLTANMPLIVAVSKNVKAATIQDFVTTLRAGGQKLNYGSAGNGNITHLSALLFLQAVNATATHVPYKSEAPVVTDLIGAQIDFYVGTAAGLVPVVQDKRVRGLAVTSLKRMPNLPDVPTLNETVAKNLELGAWSGIVAPANTPAAIVNTLNSAANAALQDRDLRAKLAVQSTEPRGGSVAEYRAFLKSEAERWGGIIRAARVTVD
jgi:tripartite-type tricarboxylate transporter receptor subunit TctC